MCKSVISRLLLPSLPLLTLALFPSSRSRSRSLSIFLLLLYCCLSLGFEISRALVVAESIPLLVLVAVLLCCRSSGLANIDVHRVHLFPAALFTLLGLSPLPIFALSDKRSDEETHRPIVRALVTPYASLDRKSTRLNSSHMSISYAVFCLKK